MIGIWLNKNYSKQQIHQNKVEFFFLYYNLVYLVKKVVKSYLKDYLKIIIGQVIKNKQQLFEFI